MFSKLAWCVPLKNKSAASLVTAFTQLLSNGAPNTLQTDKGTGFLNRSLQKLLKEHCYASFCDAQRRKEGEHCREVQSDTEDKCVALFHENPVGSICRRPGGIHAIVQRHISPQYRYGSVRSDQYQSGNHVATIVWSRKCRHRVGDRVRISKAKRHFEKGYMANWTEELFTIVDAHRSGPPVYRLVDWHGDKLDGTFYEQELQKVVVPKGKTYRVESILRWHNKRREVLVKWSGYPTPFNSWMDAKTLVNY